jgi:hypothetical protein
VIVRQVLIPTVSSKRELQNAHAGKSEVVAKSFDIGSDDAKVFGDDGQFPERVSECNEKLSARNINPLTSLGCFVASRYFPTRGEASKVIDAQNVNGLKRSAQPIYPPSKARRAHRVPVVNRIAPKLPRAAEVIGWNARDDYRPAVAVEFEHLWMTPHIRRVVRDEDRRVSDYSDAALTAVPLQCPPLTEEQILIKLLGLNLFTQGVAGCSDRVLVATNEPRFPINPAYAAVRGFECTEQGVIFQPPAVFVTEFIELVSERVVVRCFENLKGAFEQRSLELDHPAEIDSHRKSRSVAEIIGGQQTTINEPPGTDEQSVARERREALIRRVAVTRRAERQHLPEALIT